MSGAKTPPMNVQGAQSDKFTFLSTRYYTFEVEKLPSSNPAGKHAYLPSPCRITGRVLHSYKAIGKTVACVSSAGETGPTVSPSRTDDRI